jgi:hypothetical protein
MTGDGFPDILTVNSGDNTISVLKNIRSSLDPFGVPLNPFAAQIKTSVGNNPQSLAVGDFNGDHRMDVATADYGNSTVSVLLGKGDGSFLPRVIYPVGGGPYSIVAADMDTDSVTDLVVTNTKSDTISLLRGVGNGTFLAKVDYPTGHGPKIVVAGDFDGNGKTDLAVGNWTDTTVSVYYQTTPGDVNQNGLVQVDDVSLLLKYWLGLKAPSAWETSAGDVRPSPGVNGRAFGDGQLNNEDANWTLRRALGLVSSPN